MAFSVSNDRPAFYRKGKIPGDSFWSRSVSECRLEILLRDTAKSCGEASHEVVEYKVEPKYICSKPSLTAQNTNNSLEQLCIFQAKAALALRLRNTEWAIPRRQAQTHAGKGGSASRSALPVHFMRRSSRFAIWHCCVRREKPHSSIPVCLRRCALVV